MCTAVTYQTNDHYFGRNLDFEHAYRETVTITPRNFPFIFRKSSPMHTHYAMIGMATVDNNYPLYYDATNECGLSMAGLYFPGNAVYLKENSNKDNIAPFEFIPWILGQCEDVAAAERILDRLNLADIAYSSQYPQSPMHWLIADRHRAITVEPTAQGIRVFYNPIGVLTNNPPFDYHMHNLTNYLNLTHNEPTNRFSSHIQLQPYSRGMGAIGMPGDLSSASRFVRASFTKLNSVSGNTETESISQFFHILGSVAQQKGCVRVGDSFEKTIYSSCCNVDKGIYYYTTYGNSQITGISLRNTDLDSKKLSTFSLVSEQQIRMEN